MFSQFSNARFLKALLRQPVDRTPVWVMRQAGRYLPEYRATRARAGDFLTLCKSPDLACEVTLQPLERYPLDAAILFSDILTIPDAMNVGLEFAAGEGPQITRPVRDAVSIRQLGIPDAEDDLGYVMEAVRTIKKALNYRVPLIGFAGSPWTLACYMIEGHGSKDFARAKAMLYRDPTLLHELLGKLTRATVEYLQGQIRAGVDAVMIFDTWGGLLSTSAYQEFSLQYMKEVIAQLPREREGQTIPKILFTKGGGQWLELMADSGADALGLDWTTEIADAKARVGSRVALQGNLDPAVLLSDPETIRREVKKILQGFGQGPGHVFNLGHGITPEVSPENMAVLVSAVHEFSA